jgi:hypothetical protein
MSGKKTLIALSTAIALGLAGSTAALASDHEDQSGGFKIGPLGQAMGGPAEWGATGAPRGTSAYGYYVAPIQKHRPVHHNQNR